MKIRGRDRAIEKPIVWTGDLDDDCTARWAGLILRAEMMDKDWWWWCVYDMEIDDGLEIDSSNNYDKEPKTGESARNEAERVAREYLNLPIGENLNAMTTTSDTEIFSSRILNASVETVYQAFANPAHLKKWWGPQGFTNTIHEFDLRPGGKWVLTMHGPEKGNYENSSVFKTVEPLQLIAWTRISQPHFDMEVAFEKISASTTRISFRMIFATEEECEKVRRFAEPKNEENFDRLEKELLHVVA